MIERSIFSWISDIVNRRLQKSLREGFTFMGPPWWLYMWLKIIFKDLKVLIYTKKYGPDSWFMSVKCISIIHSSFVKIGQVIIKKCHQREPVPIILTMHFLLCLTSVENPHNHAERLLTFTPFLGLWHLHKPGTCMYFSNQWPWMLCLSMVCDLAENQRQKNSLKCFPDLVS